MRLNLQLRFTISMGLCSVSSNNKIPTLTFILKNLFFFVFESFKHATLTFDAILLTFKRSLSELQRGERPDFRAGKQHQGSETQRGGRGEQDVAAAAPNQRSRDEENETRGRDKIPQCGVCQVGELVSCIQFFDANVLFHIRQFGNLARHTYGTPGAHN